MKYPVTLQINTAPVDFDFLTPILTHQLKVFGKYCKEILLTVETKQSQKSRWKSDSWDQNLAKIYELAGTLQSEYPQMLINRIDYSDEAREEVSRYFLKDQSKLIPFKDFRGGPYYSYYYGLHSATQPYILHMDSDLMFCGNGDNWLNEALKLLEEDSKAMFTAPLIGAPLPEGSIMPQVHKKRYNPVDFYRKLKNGYVYEDLSTRLFLVEKKQLKYFCPLTHPHFDQIVKSWIRKTQPYHTPERSISVAMQKAGKYRVDFLGSEEGLWSIHLGKYQNPDYREVIDYIVERIEEGSHTEDQKGWHDLTYPHYLQLREEFFGKKKAS